MKGGFVLLDSYEREIPSLHDSLSKAQYAMKLALIEAMDGLG